MGKTFEATNLLWRFAGAVKFKTKELNNWETINPISKSVTFVTKIYTNILQASTIFRGLWNSTHKELVVSLTGLYIYKILYV